MSGRIYDFLRLISDEGGQADVYELSVRPSGERFAAKFPKELTAHLPEVQQRFEREAGHYQRLHAYQAHPHVSRMVEFINWKGRRGILLELMETSFARRIKSGITDTEKVQAIRQAALGLAHLHHYGIVHRDMKPSNLLRARDGRYVVADLGCATVAGASAINLTQASIGTPGLMAPEQHSPYFFADRRTDMYGLGTCIASAFLGQYPEQSPAEDGQGVQVALDDRMGELDQAFQDLLWKCLNPDADQRFGSMEAFIAEWDDLARRGVLATPATFLQKVVKGAAAVGLVALVASALAKAAK